MSQAGRRGPTGISTRPWRLANEQRVVVGVMGGGRHGEVPPPADHRTRGTRNWMAAGRPRVGSEYCDELAERTAVAVWAGSFEPAWQGAFTAKAGGAAWSIVVGTGPGARSACRRWRRGSLAHRSVTSAKPGRAADSSTMAVRSAHAATRGWVAKDPALRSSPGPGGHPVRHAVLRRRRAAGPPGVAGTASDGQQPGPRRQTPSGAANAEAWAGPTGSGRGGGRAHAGCDTSSAASIGIGPRSSSVAVLEVFRILELSAQRPLTALDQVDQNPG